LTTYNNNENFGGRTAQKGVNRESHAREFPAMKTGFGIFPDDNTRMVSDISPNQRSLVPENSYSAGVSQKGKVKFGEYTRTVTEWIHFLNCSYFFCKTFYLENRNKSVHIFQTLSLALCILHRY
jgi:hypothetical protein